MTLGLAVFSLFLAFVTLIAIDMIGVCLGKRRWYHDLTGDQSAHIQDALTRRRK